MSSGENHATRSPLRENHHATRSPSRESRENPEKLQRTSSGAARIPQGSANSSSSSNRGGLNSIRPETQTSRSQPPSQRDQNAPMNPPRRERSDSFGKITERERNGTKSTTPPIRSSHSTSYSTNEEKYSGRNSRPDRASVPISGTIRKEQGRPSNSTSAPTIPTGADGPSTRWGSRSVELFEKLEQIGEGTYGKVYMARNRQTNEIVALKKVRMANEKEGFPITAIREIKILKELHHENIVQLKEIVTSKASNKDNNKGKVGKQSIYMVFEYMDHDLTGLMLSEGKSWRPTPAHIKCYMKQLLEGLHYCHSNNVLHRDIKGSNLLTNNKGELKLADFGLARPYTEQVNNYTNRVITLWYRPPELLLGAVQYGTAIDMWSAGCILTELLIGRAIFPGRTEIDQLELIFKLCGTPNEQNWPDVESLPWYKMLKPQQETKRCLAETLLKMNPSIPPEALDLVDRLLTLDPKQRITASEALDSDYFWTLPEPAKTSQLPQYPSSHEYQAKKKRQQQQQQPINGDNNSKRQKGPSGAPVPASGPPSGGPKYPPYPPSGAPPSHGAPSHGHHGPPHHQQQQQHGPSSYGPPPHSQSSHGHYSYPPGQRGDNRGSHRGSYSGNPDSRPPPPNQPPPNGSISQRPPQPQDQRGRAPNYQRPPPPSGKPPPQQRP